MNKKDLEHRLTNTRFVEKEMKTAIPNYFNKKNFEETIEHVSRDYVTPSKDLTGFVGVVWNQYNIEYESERRHLINRIKDAVCVFYGPLTAENFEKSALGPENYLKMDNNNRKNASV